MMVGSVVKLDGLTVVYLGRTLNGQWVFAEINRFGDPNSRAPLIAVPNLMGITKIDRETARTLRDRRGAWSRQ